MRILGLDPGSQRTGYGFVVQRGGELHWLASGTLRPPRQAALPDRLLDLYRQLRDLLATTRPDLAAIEASFVGRHAHSALVLGQARGALIVATLDAGIPLCEYAPRKIKLAVTGLGGANKGQVHAMVRSILRAAPETMTHDEADALAVAICHAHRLRGLESARPRRVNLVRGT